MKTKITAHEIIDHGVEHEAYFQGCGTGGYNEVFTGIGDSAHEALEDALELAAMSGYDVEGIPNELSKEQTVPDEAEDNYHYVSIRIKTTDE